VRVFCLFLFALSLATPAYAGFDVIDFKYNSLTHIGFKGSVVQTTATPAEAADLVASFLRSEGASVTSLEPSTAKLSQTAADADCERWSQSIFQAEFAAVAANSLKQYKKIDRTGQPAGCSAPGKNWLQYGYSVGKLSAGSGYRLTAVVDRSINVSQRVVRPAFSTIFSGFSSASMWSMVPSNIQTDVNFQTNFEVLLWRDAGDSTTSVFVLASPESNGLVPGPGSSIGYLYRNLADGRAESVAARNLLTYVVQKSLPSSAAATAR
jgi:hypothetical protein